MAPLTPEEREIMRLWRVIQKLTQWKDFRMTDKEEAVFGAVYAEFTKTRTPRAIVAAYEASEARVRASLQADLVTTAAQTLRALYDLMEAR
jgi:hypothetical protein